MTVTPVQLCQPTLLTGSAATLYTAPASVKASIIKDMSVCNTDSVPRTFTIHLIPSGGTASVTNMLIDARQLAAGETQTVFEALGKTLLAGGFVQALASTTSVINIQGSVAEVTQ